MPTEILILLLFGLCLFTYIWEDNMEGIFGECEEFLGKCKKFFGGYDKVGFVTSEIFKEIM